MRPGRCSEDVDFEKLVKVDTDVDEDDEKPESEAKILVGGMSALVERGENPRVDNNAHLLKTCHHTLEDKTIINHG